METQRGRLGLVLILAGALFLFGRLFDWDFGEALWPLFILLPGLALLAVAFSSSSGSSGLLVPGCVITTLGLLFFVQNATDHYESWAYAWTLMPAAVGAGLYLTGQRTGNPQLSGQGRRMAGIAGAGFLVGALFFEGFIFGDLADTWLFRMGLPLVLIAAGVFLLYRGDVGRRGQ